MLGCQHHFQTCRSGKSSCCRQSVEFPISSTKLTQVTLSGWAELRLTRRSSGELRFSRTWGELVLSTRGGLRPGWELRSSVSILEQSKNLKPMWIENICKKEEKLECWKVRNFQAHFWRWDEGRRRCKPETGRATTEMPQSFSSWPPTVHGILCDQKTPHLVSGSR